MLLHHGCRPHQELILCQDSWEPRYHLQVGKLSPIPSPDSNIPQTFDLRVIPMTTYRRRTCDDDMPFADEEEYEDADEPDEKRVLTPEQVCSGFHPVGRAYLE